MKEKTIHYVLIGLALVVALVGSYFGLTLPAPEIPQPAVDVEALQATVNAMSEELDGMRVAEQGASFSVGFTPCYQELDSTEWVAGDGCTWTMENGSTLDIQNGASVSLPSVTQGNTVITGTLTVSGTSNLVGNVYDSGGTFTVADNAAITGTLDVQGASLQYGPNDLYPIGAANSGFEMDWGRDTITGTLAVVHTVTTPTTVICSLGQTPGATTAQLCSAVFSGSTVTVSVWLTNATPSAVGAVVDWIVIGLP